MTSSSKSLSPASFVQSELPGFHVPFSLTPVKCDSASVFVDTYPDLSAGKSMMVWLWVVIGFIVMGAVGIYTIVSGSNTASPPGTVGRGVILLPVCIWLIVYMRRALATRRALKNWVRVLVIDKSNDSVSECLYRRGDFYRAYVSHVPSANTFVYKHHVHKNVFDAGTYFLGILCGERVFWIHIGQEAVSLDIEQCLTDAGMRIIETPSDVSPIFETSRRSSTRVIKCSDVLNSTDISRIVRDVRSSTRSGDLLA